MRDRRRVSLLTNSKVHRHRKSQLISLQSIMLYVAQNMFVSLQRKISVKSEKCGTYPIS